MMPEDSRLLVEPAENAGVERIFGGPGEENLDGVESLRCLPRPDADAQRDHDGVRICGSSRTANVVYSNATCGLRPSGAATHDG
jgi:hypothetical protein